MTFTAACHCVAAIAMHIERTMRTLRIVVAEPHRPADERWIADEIGSLQAIVGDQIEPYYHAAFAARGLLLYVNADSRSIRERNLRIDGTWLHGSIVVLRVDGENDASLTSADVSFARCVLDTAERSELN